MKINGTRKYFLSERELAHLSGLRVIRQSGMHSATSEESPNSSFVSALRQLLEPPQEGRVNEDRRARLLCL